MFCTARFRKFAGSLARIKNITRTLRLIGTSELFDSLTVHRSLPHDIEGAESGNEVVPITFLQREREREREKEHKIY